MGFPERKIMDLNELKTQKKNLLNELKIVEQKQESLNKRELKFTELLSSSEGKFSDLTARLRSLFKKYATDDNAQSEYEECKKDLGKVSQIRDEQQALISEIDKQQKEKFAQAEKIQEQLNQIDREIAIILLEELKRKIIPEITPLVHEYYVLSGNILGIQTTWHGCLNILIKQPPHENQNKIVDDFVNKNNLSIDRIRAAIPNPFASK